MNSSNTPNPAELLNKINDYVEAEQLSAKTVKLDKDDPKLIQAVLDVAADSKGIMKGLYYDFRKTGGGNLRKLKNLLIGKIANIVRNTLERPLLTQQKFNEQSYYLIAKLLERQTELEKKIAALEGKRN